MQEVETEQYHKLFLPELEQLGYTGIFSPKSRAKTMQEEEKKYVDGCAVFWKVEKLVEFAYIFPDPDNWSLLLALMNFGFLL